jgi:hypothetical protein
MVTNAVLDYTPMLCAIIERAWREALRFGPYSEAWNWLILSEDCEDYCLLLNINFDQIQRWLSGL